MSKVAIIGGIVLLLVVIGVVVYFTMMKGEEPVAVAPAAVAPAAPVVPPPPSEYVYEFILNVPCHHTTNHGVSITDIRIDGVRAKDSELTAHINPGWTTCNSKSGGYDCEEDKMGWNDPEPATPQPNDLTCTQWTPEEIPVGSKVFTITTPTKVGEFEIDYHRPKYAPGWIIKENGVEVLKETVNGGTGNTPTPKKIKYTIP